MQVEEVEEFWWAKSPDCSKFEGDQSERWGHMATKLRLWQMKQYQRILYLDADTVLTGASSPAPIALHWRPRPANVRAQMRMRTLLCAELLVAATCVAHCHRVHVRWLALFVWLASSACMRPSLSLTKLSRC